MGGCCSSNIQNCEIEEANNMNDIFTIMKVRTIDQITAKKEVDLYITNPKYKPKLADVKNHSLIELKEHSHFLKELIDNFTKTYEIIFTYKDLTLDNDIKDCVSKISSHRLFFSEDVSSLLQDVNALRVCLEEKRKSF